MPELTEPIHQESNNTESIIPQADVSTDQSVPETPRADNSSVNSILMSRRQFLRLAGGATAATVLASAAGPGRSITRNHVIT